MEALGLDPAFWQGRQVFVTGHTGFKGSWLALWLQAMGAEVRGYALAPPTEPSLFVAAGVGEAMESITGDLADLPYLCQSLSEQQPEVVLHLAAQAIVRRAYSEPRATFATNVMGTVHLLEAVRFCPSVRAVVVVTSDKCYENREWPWGYRENDALGGHDPYAASKACAEIATASFRRSFFAKAGPAVATVRAGNVIGGGDWGEDRLLPDLMRGFAAGRPVRLRHPGAVRPWQHVLDPLAGYLLLAQRLATEGSPWAEAWNFGPPAEGIVPVAMVVERAAALWGGGAAWEGDAPDQPHETRFLALDSAKARARLGWRPRLDLPAALALTVAWYRAYQAGAAMRPFTLGQIQSFLAGGQP
ncbi:MAG: CDP-glucose 4,6-dehydratase [Thermodesulfobacteriota bacterium]